VQQFKIFVSERSVVATGSSVNFLIWKVIHSSPVTWQ